MTKQRRDIELLNDVLAELKRCYEAGAIPTANCIRKLESYSQSVDSSFGMYVRQHPLLQQNVAHLSIQNLDWIVHQFKTVWDKNGSRRVMNMMFIEEKTHGAKSDFAQADTLTVIDQCMKLRSKPRTLRGDKPTLRYHGLHLMQFSGSGPKDSETIKWDGIIIPIDSLDQILRFERHPRTLRLRDERRHHANQSALTPLFN